MNLTSRVRRAGRWIDTELPFSVFPNKANLPSHSIDSVTKTRAPGFNSLLKIAVLDMPE